MAKERNENVINTLTTDQYGLLKSFNEFTGTYFDIKPDASKLGLFGYISEVSAHIAKSGMFHRNMMYGEIALNTAMLPSTIYNTATDENMSIPKAAPAKATVIVDVKLKDIEDLLDASQTGYIVLDRFSFLVKLDDDEFRLPYSLILKQDNLSLTAFYASVAFMDRNGTTVSKEYDISSSFSKYISNPFCPLKTYVDTDTNEKYLSMRIDVFNYKIEEDENIIYASKLDGSLIFPVKFSDSLFEFNVQYKATEDEDYEIIPQFPSQYLVNSGLTKYCFYKIIDDSNYEVYFSPNSTTFRLALNSTVKTTTFTTLGDACNYTYTGIPTVSDDNFKLEFRAAIYDSPAGGKAKPSLMEYKKQIFNERRKVAYKASEDDLNSYIANISNSAFGDGSRVLFVKTEDDIIKREFMAFNMIMDQQSNPYPTNTANITIRGNTRMIDATMPIIYDETDGEYKLYSELSEETYAGMSLPELIQTYLKDPSKFVYFLPFTMSIEFLMGTTNGFSISYYNENINDIYPVSYIKLASGSTDVPVINYISMYRNPSYMPKFEMKMSVTTEDPYNYAFVLCLINKDSSEVEYRIPFFYNGDIELFTAEVSAVEISSYIANRFTSGKIKLRSGNLSYDFWKNITPIDSEVESDIILLNPSYKCRIYTLEPIDKNKNIDDNKTDFDEYSNSVLNFSVHTNEGNVYPYADYRVKASTDTDMDLVFFTSMTQIVKSEYLQSSNILTSVPLVGANVLYSTDRYDYFNKQLYKYIEYIKDIAMDLANSSSVNFKFYNTYGPSKQFFAYLKSADPTASAEVPIVRTNLSMLLEIDREDGYDIDVDHQIKDICREFINDINTSITNNTALNSCISFSNLITRIEQEIPSITSCNLLKINDMEFPRKITRKNDVYDYGSPDGSLITTPEFVALDLRRKPSDMSYVEELNVETIYIS